MSSAVVHPLKTYYALTICSYAILLISSLSSYPLVDIATRPTLVYTCTVALYCTIKLFNTRTRVQYTTVVRKYVRILEKFYFVLYTYVYFRKYSESSGSKLLILNLRRYSILSSKVSCYNSIKYLFSYVYNYSTRTRPVHVLYCTRSASLGDYKNKRKHRVCPRLHHRRNCSCHTSVILWRRVQGAILESKT